VKLITTSESRCYRSCPRKRFYEYELGYRPVTRDDALHFGSLMHVALEAWWREPVARLAAALSAISWSEAGGLDRVVAEELMRGYDSRWLAEPLEVLAVEVEFATELRNPATGAASRTWRLAGKLDAVARDTRDGRVLVVEHKTAGVDISTGSEYWRHLLIDDQVSNYFVGARSLGYDPVACIYDVIGKPKLRLLEATPIESRKYRKKDGKIYENQREEPETLDEFRARLRATIEADPARWFQRGEVVRLDEDEQDGAYDIWQTAKMIHESSVTGRHPRNPSACTSYGRTCAFFDVCTRTASLEDQTRFRRAEKQHEELSQEAECKTQ
jgi:hypothetical protein